MCNSGLVEEMRVYIGARDGNCQNLLSSPQRAFGRLTLCRLSFLLVALTVRLWTRVKVVYIFCVVFFVTLNSP
jgi:hypothetical protein